MCLAIPSKVIELKENNMAVVDTLGVKREASLDLLDEKADIGDWVLLHIGYAMSKIDEESARESLKLYEQILESMREEDEEILNANG
ncbi:MULTISPECIES: HypC/HybG/HupF family hydrogenase formation chaperone [Helicobacter]|uniref:HypC/HybG/HupF family hydrogenase formation chaperone n=1 Tax=Helicobacter typhlonius TaxID=76936 RepID=A0A099UEL3_9HELI|nr:MULTISPECIES: HypC/HybG/HupF family hydrogenase formation chaperone [Helicobacter]TLD78088.1 HypC/HybG/HupF family hydrogenase formation chaperone [Helicobacter typhlonius]TLD86233.1 HypC/HybG/HupF family hydrogenase formation chaperone [Helicobacter sp. MIT 03-1616]CUU39582.1 [NiFe] hydrogenase metallocenter assembly protein HypC [Helicobacter typhlonius]